MEADLAPPFGTQTKRETAIYIYMYYFVLYMYTYMHVTVCLSVRTKNCKEYLQYWARYLQWGQGGANGAADEPSERSEPCSERNDEARFCKLHIAQTMDCTSH